MRIIFVCVVHILCVVNYCVGYDKIFWCRGCRLFIWYLTPLFFSYPILICWTSSYLSRVQRKRGRGREKYIFNFNFISFGVFAQLLCSKEISSRTVWESSFFSNQALKYISRFRWLISPNSVWSYPVVFWCCLIRRFGSLAADPTRMRSELARQNRRANCQRPGGKKVLSVWNVQLNWGRVSLFRRNGSFFSSHVSHHLLSGASGNICFFKIYFYCIYFLFFFFAVNYNGT